MTTRAGRKQVLAELVAIRREVERLINDLAGDEERAFLTTIEHGESHSIRKPRPGENPLPPEIIEERYGVIEDHSGTIPPAFRQRFAKQLQSQSLE